MAGALHFLRPPGRTPIPVLPGTAADESAGQRLADVLGQLGLVGSLFGEFLSLRADLFNTDSLLALQRLPRAERPAPDGRSVRALLREEFGPAGDQLGELSREPIRQDSFRCHYSACLGEGRGAAAIVQLAQPRLEDGELDFLTARLRGRQHQHELPAAVLQPDVLRQFRQWIQAGSSFESERQLLEAVAGLPFGGGVTQFPIPVAGLCSGKVLVYRAISGTAVSELIAAGHREALHRLTEAVLEQACLLTVVPADLRLEDYVITGEGKVGLRYSGRFVPVPGPAVRHLLKYLSSAIAGNAPVSAHALLQLAGNADPGAHEAMLAELAAMEPDLRANLPYPASATMLESQWRALSRLGQRRPLYVDCLHRNLSGLSYWYSRRKSGGESGAAASHDVLEESYWPVLGSLWRRQLGELTTREGLSELFAGSGLLMVEGMRQLNQVAEDVRDGGLAVRIDLGKGGTGRRREFSFAAAAVGPLGLGVVLLLTLVVMIRWCAHFPGPAGAAAGFGAGACALGLFVIITRLDD